MIRVGILTSSRADYGIYLPLLRAMERDIEFELKLIVFGTHLSRFHGYTLSQIERDGFTPFAKIESLLLGDTPNAIASAYSLTGLKFADFWSEHQKDFDVVFALGDRYEMAAAVAASIPFGLPIAHLHGGEITLGAIDNVYRHSISLASKFHFVSAAIFAKRLTLLLDENHDNIYHTGSLGLENLSNFDFLSKEEFKKQWNIDMDLDSILVTAHPETADYEQNEAHAAALTEALQVLAVDYQIIITMPNADTSGLVFRTSFEALGKEIPSVKIVENFGSQSYFSCMKYAKLMLGNSSSGIIEAASLGKYVLNLGNRQEGRLCGENVVHQPFHAKQIVDHAKNLIGKNFEGDNPYFQAQPSKKILEIIKKHYASLS